MITKPLLASAVEDIDQIKFPVIASPKLDGIRCLKIGGKAVSRNLKPIANRYIRETLERILPDGADGEIMVGSTFQDCTSAVMSYEGQPDFFYNMFDYVSKSLDEAFCDRLKQMEIWHFRHVGLTGDQRIKLVPSVFISNKEQLAALEEKYLDEGFEGVMIRSINGKYKCGRSSVKEGILLKVKKFKDSEAEVVGFEELMHNENEQETNALGRSERSSKKDGLVPANTLGALLVRDVKSGIDFKLGTGFLQEQRKEIWDNRRKYLGRLVKYKYFEIGVKVAPRFPVFLGFRHKDDMSGG